MKAVSIPRHFPRFGISGEDEVKETAVEIVGGGEGGLFSDVADLHGGMKLANESLHQVAHDKIVAKVIAGSRNPTLYHLIVLKKKSLSGFGERNDRVGGKKTIHVPHSHGNV